MREVDTLLEERDRRIADLEDDSNRLAGQAETMLCDIETLLYELVGTGLRVSARLRLAQSAEALRAMIQHGTPAPEILARVLPTTDEMATLSLSATREGGDPAIEHA